MKENHKLLFRSSHYLAGALLVIGLGSTPVVGETLKNYITHLKILTLEEETRIRGTVTEDNGDPLPGATIAVEGTSIVTVTDVNGNFELTVPDGAELAVPLPTIGTVLPISRHC
jgi:hypothetical protein